MRVVNQGFRSTNVIAGALKCGRHFSLAGGFYDNYFRYGKERGSLNDARRVEGVQQSWMSSARNALQRLTGNSAEFQNRGGSLNVFESLGSGRYVWRDEYRQILLDGMNRHGSGLMAEPFSGIQVAVEGDLAEVVTSHHVGCYAQQKIREFGERFLRWQNVQDFSATRAYDLTFTRPGRTGGICYVECKGTTSSAETVGVELTHNETIVAIRNPGSYLVGTVTDIRVKDGRCTGGVVSVVDPFELNSRVQHLKLTFKLKSTNTPAGEVQ